MALTGWPTEAGEGQVSTETRWRKMARLWAPDGTVRGVANELAPSFSAGQITVATGAAWIDGHYAENDAPAVISASADGLLVLRYTYAGSTFAFVFVPGVTAPVQDATKYELAIAQMIAGAMTDRRTVVTTPAPVARGRWDRTAAQTIATGTATTVLWSRAVRLDDPLGDFSMNLGTGIVVLNRAGWYRVHFGIRWTFAHTGAITAGTHDVFAFVNQGGANVLTQAGYHDSNGLGVSGSTLIYSPGAENLFVQVTQKTGANRTIDGVPGTHLALERAA